MFLLSSCEEVEILTSFFTSIHKLWRIVCSLFAFSLRLLLFLLRPFNLLAIITWKHFQAALFYFIHRWEKLHGRVHNIISHISFSCLSTNCAQVLTKLFPIIKKKKVVDDSYIDVQGYGDLKSRYWLIKAYKLFYDFILLLVFWLC